MPALCGMGLAGQKEPVSPIRPIIDPTLEIIDTAAISMKVTNLVIKIYQTKLGIVFLLWMWTSIHKQQYPVGR